MRLTPVFGSAVALLIASVVQAQSPVPGTNPANRGTQNTTPGTNPANRGAQNTTPGTNTANQNAQGTATGSNSASALTQNYSTTPLYQMGDVSKSLNLTPQQINGLNQLTNQMQTRYQSDYSKLTGLTPTARSARSADLNRRYSAEWRKGASGIFNDNQLQRYQQLQYQYGGFNSLTDPSVQSRLNLTDQQRKALAQDTTWSNQQLQEINKMGATNPDKARQLYRDYRREYGQRFNKFLTPQQQTTWKQMTGESYNFSPTFSTSSPRR